MDTPAPTCPRCGRQSRPGSTCEWCGAALPGGSGAETAPWLRAGSDPRPDDVSPFDLGAAPVAPMSAGEAFFRRLAATILDSVALSVIIYPVMLVLWFGFAAAMIGAGAGRHAADQAGVMFGVMSFAMLLVFGVSLAVTIGYYGGMLSARGQTLGKMAVGLRVVGPDGRNPSFGRAVLRELIGKTVSGLIFDLGFLWMLWDPEQQTWHDKIASTHVGRVGEEVPRAGTTGGRAQPKQSQGLIIAGIIVAAFAGLMLVVVPIFAAILFPVFAQAREQARAAGCMSHMKQVGLGLSMYMEDYDERLPLQKNWCDGVLPYVKNPLMFQCPSLPGVRSGQAYNAQISAVAMDRIKTPDWTVAVFDGKGGWNLAGGANLADPRHRQGLNVGFVEGHVRWMQSLDQVVWKPAGGGGAINRVPPGRARGPGSGG